ncbi:MFS transporter [Micromonospora sp. NPDC050397]|uniref:MFS transporter n=1 Tax=Micromonospora sp. NPDC050397 TaxID=3364279 RepID=UPI00385170D8
MRTYRELFRVPEFLPLFLSSATMVASGTLRGLALATLVYTATGSPLLSALSLFGSHFAQVIGAMTLLSLADRVPPRAGMVALTTVHGLGTLALALPGMPIWGMFAVIGVLGLLGSVGNGVRWGLLGEILPGGDYLLGRSVFNMSVGVMQIGGFAIGGVLLTFTSSRRVLVLATVLCLAAALLNRFGLVGRPPRAAGRVSVGTTWRVNAWLWSAPGRRFAYLAAWVPNGLVVGNEALFVAYRPDSAAVLFVCGALGMLVGDTAMGRFVRPEWREGLLTPVQLLLGVPYLIFALSPALPLAAVAVAAASAGFSGSLLLQQRIVDLTPEEMRGQALGLHSAGMFTMQAVGASLAGLVAEWMPTAGAMVVMGLLSVAVTLSLRPGLRATRSASVDAAPGRRRS